MILFKPVGRPPEVFDFNGALMSQPVTSNPDALNSPKVYFIFVGPNWEQKGKPTAAVNSMIADAKAILKSAYLSGLKQYGSDGKAVFGDSTIDTSLNPLTWSKDYKLSNGTIDHTNNPVWFETDRILSQSKFSSWNPPAGGDARNSPIYVVARYSHDGTGVGGAYGGSNNNGPNDYTTRAVNVIDVAITSADQVDQFSWVFSHEIAERMSAGIGGLTEVSPDAGGQIADGEPEGSDYYAWRLNGSSGPVVTSYWSFLDQAFIIPDGRLQRVLLVPIWKGASWTGQCVSLQQGNLYAISPPDVKTLIDTAVQSYATSSVGGIFDLTASGQVKQYSGSGTNWTALTGTNTVASALVAGSGGSLYMLASNNGGPNQVWQYSGSGTNWTPLTTTNTSVSAIAADAGGVLYVLSANIFGTPEYKVWKYSGSGTNWTAVTDTNTYPYVYAIAAANGSLYMVAPLLLGGSKQLWRYTGLGPEWTAVTDVNDGSVDAIVAAGDVLLALATLHVGGYTGISQCGPNPNNNMPLTGTITNPSEMVVQDGIEVYMRAANNGGPNRVWQYHDTPGNWTALTGLNTNVKSIRVSADNRLYMTAANNGGPFQDWIYNGTPLDWTVV